MKEFIKYFRENPLEFIGNVVFMGVTVIIVLCFNLDFLLMFDIPLTKKGLVDKQLSQYQKINYNQV